MKNRFERKKNRSVFITMNRHHYRSPSVIRR